MSVQRKYSIDSGWIVSATDDCTCGTGGVVPHEQFCGLEQECPVEEFDNWVKHMLAQRDADHVAALAAARIEWGMSNGPAFDFARGYAESLREAREAVEIAYPCRCLLSKPVGGHWDYCPRMEGGPAIAAIDALAARQAPEPLTAAFLDEQAAWSIDTFGPGDRLDGVLDHMAKEIEEARAMPDDVSEWADLAILAFDGAQRQGITGQQFIDAWMAKFAKNRSRTWPDWRTS